MIIAKPAVIRWGRTWSSFKAHSQKNSLFDMSGDSGETSVCNAVSIWSILSSVRGERLFLRAFVKNNERQLFDFCGVEQLGKGKVNQKA